MNYCKYCGTQVNDRQHHCPHCGAKINKVSEQENVVINEPEILYDPQDVIPEVDKQVDIYIVENETPKTLGIIGLVFAFIGLSIIGFVLNIIGLAKDKKKNWLALNLSGLIFNIIFTAGYAFAIYIIVTQILGQGGGIPL